MTESLASLLAAAKAAQRLLQSQSTTTINAVLDSIASRLESGTPAILAANAHDLAKIPTSDPTYDRIMLNHDRIRTIADGLRSVAALADPVGTVLDERTRPNGLKIQKVSVPFGVVAAIYEARPNVTIDIAALCLKSRNAAVLKGGSEAQRTSEALVAIVREALAQHGLPTELVTLLPADRSLVEQLIAARGFVDLVVPRGSQQLIDWVREHARVPIIETGAGVCHTYVDEAADTDMAAAIITNAKTRRVSVCNALDTLIVHASLLPKLQRLTADLLEHRVEIRADERARSVMTYDVNLLKLAHSDDFGTEFLSLTMAIKTVDSLAEALAHIDQFGSHHSEAIVTNDSTVAELFLSSVDAACVYWNASTAFTDGGEFGMGAELGISTQKLHARGPMALPELTTYKWLIRGSGQIRPK